MHNSRNLQGQLGEILMEWMQSLKERNLVKRTGVSIYSSSELKEIQLESLEIIQIPLSIYDQRMRKNGTIKLLSEMGKKIHIRSIFLQGLILQELNSWPKFLSSNFLQHHKSFLEDSEKLNMSVLDRVLEFSNSLDSVEAILIGVSNLIFSTRSFNI